MPPERAHRTSLDHVETTAFLSPAGDPPPTTRGHAPPEGWQPAPGKGRGLRGRRPREAQITNAVAVAKELGSTTFVADFGAKAPNPAGAAYALTNAAKWRGVWAIATRWQAYAAEQRAAWENEAMTQMAMLQPTFEYAASRDPAIAPKYSAMARFFSAAKAISKRAGATRRRRANAAIRAANEPPAPAPGPDGKAPSAS